MMLGQVFSEKSFHIIVTQFVRVFVRNFEPLHCLQASLLDLQKSLLYLLVLQLRKGLLSIDALLQSLQTILILFSLI